jgi:hypothetical protein
VTTDQEVTGDGFSVSSHETRGKELSDDRTSVTFDVNGNRVRVVKPGKTVEGPVRALDGGTLVLGGPEEPKPLA